VFSYHHPLSPRTQQDCSEQRRVDQTAALSRCRHHNVTPTLTSVWSARTAVKLVYAVAPTGGFVEFAANGTDGAGHNLGFTVNFNQNVTATPAADAFMGLHSTTAAPEQPPMSAVPHLALTFR